MKVVDRAICRLSDLLRAKPLSPECEGIISAINKRSVHTPVYKVAFSRRPSHSGLFPNSPNKTLIASMGLPGFSGFPAELSILIGTWQTSPLWAAFGAGGVLVAAAFTLRAIQVSFFGSPGAATAVGDARAAHYEPITLAEKAGAALLIAATVYIGLKPDVLLDWIRPALESPLMQAALKGGAP